MSLPPHRRGPSGPAVPLAELQAALTALGVAADDGWRTDIEQTRIDDPIIDPWGREPT